MTQPPDSSPFQFSLRTMFFGVLVVVSLGDCLLSVLKAIAELQNRSVDNALVDDLLQRAALTGLVALAGIMFACHKPDSDDDS